MPGNKADTLDSFFLIVCTWQYLSTCTYETVNIVVNTFIEQLNNYGILQIALFSDILLV